MFRLIKYDLHNPHSPHFNGTSLNNTIPDNIQFNDLHIAKTYINTYVNVLFENNPFIYNDLMHVSNNTGTCECYYLSTHDSCIAFALVPNDIVYDFDKLLFTTIVATRHNQNIKSNESYKYAVIKTNENHQLTQMSNDIATLDIPNTYIVLSMHTHYNDAFNSASTMAGKSIPALYTNNNTIPLVFNTCSGIIGIVQLT